MLGTRASIAVRPGADRLVERRGRDHRAHRALGGGAHRLLGLGDLEHVILADRRCSSAPNRRDRRCSGRRSASDSRRRRAGNSRCGSLCTSTFVDARDRRGQGEADAGLQRAGIAAEDRSPRRARCGPIGWKRGEARSSSDQRAARRRSPTARAALAAVGQAAGSRRRRRRRRCRARASGTRRARYGLRAPAAGRRAACAQGLRGPRAAIAVVVAVRLTAPGALRAFRSARMGGRWRPARGGRHAVLYREPRAEKQWQRAPDRPYLRAP